MLALKKISNRIGSVVVGISMAVAIFAQSEKQAIVTQSVINMRSRASFPAEMCSQALMGTPVHILETDGGWIKIMTPEGYSGWVINNAIAIKSVADYNKWVSSSRIMVTNYFTVLREKPDFQSAVVSDVVRGNILQYCGVQGKFFKVMLPSGTIGYLPKMDGMDYNKWLSTRKPTASEILRTGFQFVGFPYLWGGTSIKGMDCSGFVKTTYYLNGIVLLRNASEQATTGQLVDLSKGITELQPADLLFFGSKDGERERVTHVAIYMGGGRFIHSSGSIHVGSLVATDPLFDEYNSKRLIRARRILNSIDKDPGIVSLAKHPYYMPIH